MMLRYNLGSLEQGTITSIAKDHHGNVFIELPKDGAARPTNQFGYLELHIIVVVESKQVELMVLEQIVALDSSAAVD